MADNNIVEQALLWNPFTQVARRAVRTLTTWRSSNEAEMRSIGVTCNQFRYIAQKRVR